MASINLRLDERTIKDGMCPVRMRISINGTSAYVSTGVKVEPRFFNGADLRAPVHRSAYMAKVKNEQLGSLVRKFDEVLFDLGRDESVCLDDMTANELRTYIVGEKKHKAKQTKKAVANGRADFIDWFDKYGQTRTTEKTRKSYSYVWRLLVEFCKQSGRERLYFDELNYALFIDIKRWVLNGRGESTRHQVESYTHAAWREARRMRIVSGEDPWLDYRIEHVPHHAAQIDYATEQEIRRFLSYHPTGSGAEWLTKVQDIVRLQWCFCGCNLLDLYHMSDPFDDHFVFVRHKLNTRTDWSVSIPAEPETLALMKQYRGADGRAFSFSADVPNYDTFQRKVNDRLERLNQLAGTNISLARVRRSWATYALRSGISERVVDMSMGHMPSGILGRSYGAYMWDETDRCTRQMIDWLNR